MIQVVGSAREIGAPVIRTQPVSLQRNNPPLVDPRIVPRSAVSSRNPPSPPRRTHWVPWSSNGDTHEVSLEYAKIRVPSLARFSTPSVGRPASISRHSVRLSLTRP